VAGADAGQDPRQPSVDSLTRPTNLKAIVPCHHAQVSGEGSDPLRNDLGETVYPIDVKVG
jgi:hypothetical protein